MIDGVSPDDVVIACLECSMLDDVEYTTDGILTAVEHVEGRGHQVLLSPADKQ